MRITVITVMCLAAAAMLATGVHAQQVRPMIGGVLIDGYDFGKDIGPKGTISYDKSKNEFKGTYAGLRMPPGRRAKIVRGEPQRRRRVR